MRRLLFVDDNIRFPDGHYVEIASLLQGAARQFGYATKLATHIDFCTDDPTLDYDLVFSVCRMLGWSLGVDGRSRIGRNPDGTFENKSASGPSASFVDTIRQSCTDRFVARNRRPEWLLNHWALEFEHWMRKIQSLENDVLVVNTADDFQLLALLRAIKQLGDKSPKQIHAIFHFAVFEGRVTARSQRMGEQINRVGEELNSLGVDLRIHATTRPLVEQLLVVGVDAGVIPYPIRLHAPALGNKETGRLNLLFGGWPRREKGSRMIFQLLKNIHQTHLLRADSSSAEARFRISMQLPSKKWRRMIPKSMHDDCRIRSSFEPPSNPDRGDDFYPMIDLITSSISTQQYQSWLDTADVGLFLYAPDRYVVRCSAVLLELLMRGIPVIVPNGCWLADQVRLAEPTGKIGFLFDSIQEIPELLDRMATQYGEIRDSARRYSKVISKRHRAEETLAAMGIAPLQHQATD